MNSLTLHSINVRLHNSRRTVLVLRNKGHFTSRVVKQTILILPISESTHTAHLRINKWNLHRHTLSRRIIMRIFVPHTHMTKRRTSTTKVNNLRLLRLMTRVVGARLEFLPSSSDPVAHKGQHRAYENI